MRLRWWVCFLLFVTFVMCPYLGSATEPPRSADSGSVGIRGMHAAHLDGRQQYNGGGFLDVDGVFPTGDPRSILVFAYGDRLPFHGALGWCFRSVSDDVAGAQTSLSGSTLLKWRPTLGTFQS